MDGIERRIQGRIHLASAIRVSGPKGVMDGTLRDLSMGGAGFDLKEMVADVGERIEIVLPFAADFEVTVMAKILRIEHHGEVFRHGVIFELIEPKLRNRMAELLSKMLEGAEDEIRRKEPRVHKRFPVEYGSAKELRGLLKDISQGGLAMYVDETFVLDEIVEVSIDSPSGDEPLILSGKVRHQYPAMVNSVQKNCVGLEFETLTAAQMSQVVNMLQGLLGIKKDS